MVNQAFNKPAQNRGLSRARLAEKERVGAKGPARQFHPSARRLVARKRDHRLVQAIIQFQQWLGYRLLF
jgi:hypothetical protein